MINIFGSPLIRQYAVVLIANLSVLATGFSLGWSSPVLVKLRNGTDSVLSRPVTEEEGSWVVSISFLSGMCGIVFTGYLLDTIGRKNVLILSCLPRIPMVLMYLFAKELWVILVARVLCGLLDSLVFAAVAAYASEMASIDVRGALGTLLQINSSFGILLALGIGPFVSYVTLNVILLAVVVGCSIPLLFLPESPYFLYSKGKHEEAQNMLMKLRGSDILANEEIREYEAASKDQGKVKIIELFKNKVFLKGAAISIILGFSFQANGYTAVAFYLQSILETTNTSVQPEISSVIIGSIQMLASFCTTIVTDRFGRKSILISTTAGVSLGVIGLGVFFKVTEDQQYVAGFLNYLPLASMILIVFCYSAGIASILWVLISEIFEGRTRAVGMSIAIFVSTVTGFATTKTMPNLTMSLGPAMTYWMFGIVCILFIMFTVFFIPETKGKSFAEIQEILGNKKSDENLNGNIEKS